jgi:hypothetical protein
MSGAIHVLPLYIFLAWTGKITFVFISKLWITKKPKNRVFFLNLRTVSNNVFSLIQLKRREDETLFSFYILVVFIHTEKFNTKISKFCRHSIFVCSVL